MKDLRIELVVSCRDDPPVLPPAVHRMLLPELEVVGEDEDD